MSDPTEKQLSFINRMCFVLEIQYPKIRTKKEAQNFITNHIEDYEYKLADIETEGSFIGPVD